MTCLRPFFSSDSVAVSTGATTASTFGSALTEVDFLVCLFDSAFTSAFLDADLASTLATGVATTGVSVLVVVCFFAGIVSFYNTFRYL